MADVQDTRNALWRRDEQLKRWHLSDTFLETAERKNKDSKIKFQDGCVFLAACSSGDTDEVEKLLDKGADINTANIDGLTALHQACIDDNVDMVEFLIQHGADIDACDNEGWTALHATSSCGFIDVARYLIEQGANLAAVNNEGELAIDLADGDDMEQLISDEMDKQGVDAELARNEEEEVMLKDANQWLNSNSDGNSLEETPNPKTGATALHVAAAKGYIKVMTILLQAGADCDARDFDGWTPLHAAAHWGMEDACKCLVDNFCNMDIKNNAGQTAMDIADPDVEPLLEQLKKKQASLKKDREENQLQNDISTRNVPPLKRRSSVTRMSVDQKASVVQKTAEEEREALRRHQVVEEKEEEPSSKSSEDDVASSGADASSSSSAEASSSGASSAASSEDEEEEPSSPALDTAKQNEINRQTSLISTPQSESRRRMFSSSGSGDSQETKNSRSFEPPKRDEEKEVERKARAKRARESRRSTQGVTKEDLVMAEQALQAADKVGDRTSALATVDDRSDKENSRPDSQESLSSLAALRGSTARGRTTTGTGSEDKKEGEESSLLSNYRRSRDSGILTDNSSSLSSYSSTRGLRGSTNLSTSTTTSTTSSITPSTTTSSVVGSTATTTVISSTAPSTTPFKYRSKYMNSRNLDSTDDKTATETEGSHTEEQQRKEADKEDPSQKSSAIRARRKRDSRRPTGKVTLEDLPSSSEDQKESKEKEETKKDEDRQTLSSQRYGSGSRYSSDSLAAGSSTSLYGDSGNSGGRYGGSATGSRPGSASSFTPASTGSYSRTYSSTSLPESKLQDGIDYKKLYEEEKMENDKMKRDVKKLQQDLHDTRLDLEKAKLKSDPSSRSSSTTENSSERREKRALERKISELEEELKQIHQLRAENNKLRDENRALTRVVSKLTK